MSLFDRLSRIATETAHAPTRIERLGRFGAQLVVLGAQQLRQDRAGQMAAALSFRTLFGLIPVLVLGTLVSRAFDGGESVRGGLRSFLDGLGLGEIATEQPDVISGAADGVEAAAAAAPEAATEVAIEAEAAAPAVASLTDQILDVLSQVESINLAAITWVGVIVLCYSAIGLMSTIENSFNVICRCPEPRNWLRRILTYWTVLTLGPTMLLATAGINAWIESTLLTALHWQILIRIAGLAMTFFLTWLALLAAYRLVPATPVPLRAAMVGAVFAALLVGVGRTLLGMYVENALSVKLLSGIVGFVPIFMFWVYLMWLSILLGLEVAWILVRRKAGELDRLSKPPVGIVDPAAIVLVAGVVAERFVGGRTATVSDVAIAAGVSERAAQVMLERLADERVVIQVSSGGESSYSMGQPTENLDISELLKIGQDICEPAAGQASTVAKKVLDDLRAAQSRAAEGLRLATN